MRGYCTLPGHMQTYQWQLYSGKLILSVQRVFLKKRNREKLGLPSFNSVQ
jgi:hypothetical protein